MKTATLIDKINALNAEGVRLSGSAAGYNDAFTRHSEALTLALAGIDVGGIEPDYATVSAANLAYIFRRRDNDPQTALGLLSYFFECFDSATFFGGARILEELALIRHYHPRAGSIVNDLKLGYQEINDAIENYTRALENNGETFPEIVDKPTIQNRLLRSMGIASAISTTLATKVESSDQEFYQRESITWAQREVDGRLKAGETAGSALGGAYHTLGVAQTELADIDVAMYDAAKSNLLRAQELAAERPMVQSVLRLRLAWLNYRAKPEETRDETRELLDAVLQDQDTPARWDAGVHQALRDQLTILGAHLGEGYTTRITNMYTSQ